MTSGLVFWLVFTPAAVGGWRAFQIVSSGWTATRTERSLHRHLDGLGRITKEPR